MRLSSIQWLLCAASSAATAATAATAAAKVLVFDSNQSSPPGQAPPQQTVDPDTARLIFAQRLGLGQYHSIAGADEESIRHINAFSSQQQPLFAHEKHTEPISRFLVMVEGVDYDAEDEIKTTIGKGFRSFSIAPAPHPADGLELFKTFTAEGHETPTTGEADYQLSGLLAQLKVLPPTAVERFDNRHAMLLFTVSKKEQLRALNQGLGGLAAMAFVRPSSLTFVFIPPAASSTEPSKSPFGLTKRDSKALRAPQEQPLISAQNSAAAAAQSFAPPEPVFPKPPRL